MIIENVIVTDNLKNIFFCCNLSKCLGACCIEGDAGAPITDEELGIIEDISDLIMTEIDDDAKKIIADIGFFDYDMAGNIVTPLKPNEECIYMAWENNHTICIFEKLYNEKIINFQKPISCHLYPIRVIEEGAFEKILLHRWHICEDAYKEGRKDGIALFDFLEKPLIRKYGLAWYNRLMIKYGLDPHKNDKL